MRITTLILIVAVLGCNEILECDLDPNTDTAIVAFYNSTDSTSKIVEFASFSTSSTTGTGAIDTAASFFLPLDAAEQSITYYFQTDSTTYDLRMSYDADVYLYSPDCGPSFIFSNLQAETTTFDTVVVVGDRIYKDIILNVEVYF